ncbi:MAG: ChaN family lipoprotein, partial [Deltaproteobacteria bacterium]|nr:ChaN family lipoprotein [Deltaproteobacteria bacterium]
MLAGRIWDVNAGEFLTPREFMERAQRSRFLLLGEKHDHPDHHIIQAWIIRALVADGRRPVVAFEMFSPDQLPALRRQIASHPRDAIGLARAVRWEESGWP